MKKLNRILLVDDDKTNNYLNEELLRDLEITHHIEVLLNGKQALDSLKNHCLGEDKQGCPAMVIFDHFMPVMDGMEMIKALFEQGFMQQTNTVFILLGIHTNKTDIEAFQKLGVQEFTSKPLSEQTIIEAYYKYWGGETAQQHT